MTKTVSIAVMTIAPLVLAAQTFQGFQQQVTEITLANGLRLFVAERHEAPVASFHTYVRAGSVDDPSGRTGLAHMFEGLATRGTDSIGTRDWTGEKKALDAVDEAYTRLEAERGKPKADLAKVGAVEYQFKRAVEVAQTFVKSGDFARILEENGATGLAAATTADATSYTCSLPSNRVELWFLMESQRLQRPVFREFYPVRDAVAEEYRERVESNPQNRLAQAFLATAITAHQYRNPLLGWPADLAWLRRQQAREFFDQYYVPANIAIAIVGDVVPAEVQRMAEKYFGPMPARPLPPAVHTEDPPQRGPKTVVLESAGQPLLMIGYKRPSQLDPDDAVFDILQLVLSAGHTGILSRELGQEKKVAFAAQAQATYPGGRYPCLFAFFLTPAPGRTVDENQKAVEDILNRLGTTLLDPVALQTAKMQARATVIRRLGNNAGLAWLLATYAGEYGDWKRMFSEIDDMDNITPADVRRVVRQYFVPNGRTTAYTVPPPPRVAAPATGGR